MFNHEACVSFRRHIRSISSLWTKRYLNLFFFYSFHLRSTKIKSIYFFYPFFCILLLLFIIYFIPVVDAAPVVDAGKFHISFCLFGSSFVRSVASSTLQLVCTSVMLSVWNFHTIGRSNDGLRAKTAHIFVSGVSDLVSIKSVKHSHFLLWWRVFEDRQFTLFEN